MAGKAQGCDLALAFEAAGVTRTPNPGGLRRDPVKAHQSLADSVELSGRER